MKSSKPTRQEMYRLEARVCDPERLSDSERERWHAFCEENDGLDSPFFSATYARAVSASRRGVRVAVIRDRDDIVAFFPFQFPSRWHALMGHAEPVGGHMTDVVGLIHSSGFRIAPQALLRLCKLQYFLFTHLPESQSDAGLTGDSVDTGLAIDLKIGAEGYWQDIRARKKAFVIDIKRRERRLIETHGPLHFNFQAMEQRDELKRLIHQKTGQYDRTRVTNALASTWARKMVHKLAASKDSDCAGVVSTLYAGDTWAASHFGIRNQNVLHLWFPVYNTSLRAFSPGHLLLKAMISEAPSLGIARIDRGAGSQAWKQILSNNSRSFHRGAWWLPGARSLASRASMSMLWRARTLVR